MTYIGFLGLTAGIRDPHVFDVPSICTKAQTVDPVSIWLHESFYKIWVDFVETDTLEAKSTQRQENSRLGHLLYYLHESAKAYIVYRVDRNRSPGSSVGSLASGHVLIHCFYRKVHN